MKNFQITFYFNHCSNLPKDLPLRNSKESFSFLLPYRVRIAIVILLFSPFSINRISAQTVCGEVDLSCFKNTSDISLIRCVNGSQNLNTLVNEGVLLPANQAANTAQYIVVNGSINVNINYKFATGTEIIFTQNSGMTVAPDNNLYIYGTYLHGCSYLWSGIVVPGGASIVITGSTLEDAIKGIWVQGSGSQFSKIAAFYNNFNKNFISIELGVGSFNTTKVSLAKGGITANIFDGAGSLLSGVGATMPYAGIRILRTTPLAIGSTGFSSVFPLNNFINYIGEVSSPNKPRAIEVQNSDVTIQNCRFENIGRLNQGYVSGYGVAAISENGTNSLVFIGLGQNSNPTFTGVSCPISIQLGKLKASQINSTDTYVGIYYFNSGTTASTTPGSIRIDHCTFDRFRSKTGPVFIGESGKLLLSNLSIKNCIIRDNAQIVFQPTLGATLIDEIEFRSGIRIVSSIQTSISILTIQDNEIYNDFKNGSSSYQIAGMRLVNIIGGIIRDNKCYDNNSAGNAIIADRFKGIWLDNCSSAIIYSNTVYGSSDAYLIPNKESEGISLYESGDCELLCNDVDLVTNGISFKGEGCDQTSLSQNKFNTHHNGLYLFSDAVIGQQGAFGPEENKWLSSAALLDGNYDYGGFDPNNIFDLQRIGLSKFTINNANQNSIYWASPRTIGGVTDLDYWFTDDHGQFPSAPNLTACPNGFTSGGGRLSDADLHVLSSNYPPYMGYTASVWEAGLRLFNNLDMHPSLRTFGSAALAYYNNNSVATLGKLYTALKTVRFIGQSTQNIIDKQTEIDTLLDQIYVLDAQIINAQNDTQESQLLAQRDILITEYLQKKSEYEQLVATVFVASQQQANTQLAALTSASTFTAWEQNLKTVLQYQLGILATGQSLSQTQIGVLQTIANQCRYQGGFGVLLARKMLPGQQYDDNILCSGRSSDPDNKRPNEVVIYPNPANDFIHLGASKETDAGSALLFDALGRMVRNYTWSGLGTRMDISDIPNGTYFLKITLEGQPSVIKKVVVLR